MTHVGDQTTVYDVMEMRSMRYTCAAAALGFMSLAFGTIAYSAAHHTIEPLWVALSSDGLTVYAEDVPLRSVLDEVRRVTGIQIRLDELDSNRLTIAFEDLPIEEGLRRLLRGKSFFMVSVAPGGVAQAHIFQPGRVVPTRKPFDSPPVAARVGPSDREALANPPAPSRARALERLAANANTREATEALIDILRRESDSRLVERALDIVGRNPVTPLDVVMKVAQSSPEPRVRIKALTHLTERGVDDPRVRYTLELFAIDDSAPEVRRAARRLLQSLALP